MRDMIMFLIKMTQDTTPLKGSRPGFDPIGDTRDEGG